jgi:hypothetical protein
LVPVEDALKYLTFQEKMKILWADVEDMTDMYKTDNLKLENPLSEVELNCEIRYMLTKR